MNLRQLSPAAILSGTAVTIVLQMLVGVELMILLGMPEFSPTASEEELDAEIMAVLTTPKAVLFTLPLLVLASVMGTYATVKIAKKAYVLHALIVAVAAIALGYLIDDPPSPLWYDAVTNGTVIVAALAMAVFLQRRDARKNVAVAA